MKNDKEKGRTVLAKPGNYNDEKVGTNIYNSRDYYRHKETEHQKAKAHWDAAKDPMTTGIVPMYYNTLHVKQDAEKIPNSSYNNKLIYNVIDMLSDATKEKIQRGLKANPMHDGARNVKPEWGILMDRPRDTSKDREGQNPLDQIGGGLVPGKEDFTHNNMVPFYGGNITQDTRAQNRAKEGKLELYTGQFKLNRPQKQECGLFFKPVAGLTNIHGSSVNGQHRDLSRYNPSNTGKKNNEAPIERIQVGPGLNRGYTAEPSGGFHQTLRIMPKDITQLRVDPVLETEGRVKAGASYIKKRTLTPQVYRNRQELLMENKNGERNFTTVGAVHGRTLRPNIILRDTNRKKSRHFTAPAKSASHTKHRVTPKTKVSRRRNFVNTPFRNAGSQSEKRINDYGRSGYKARANNRKLTGCRTHIIAPTGYKRPKKYSQDTARKTRKQHLIKHARPYGNFHSQKPSHAPSYNPQEWAAKTTIKETTEDFNHTGFQGQVHGGVQPSYNPQEWAARTTVKQTTQDSNHIGFQGQVHGGLQPSYNPVEWAAKTTIKETTENKRHRGWMKQLGAGKVKKYNLDPARTTIRETTNYDGYGVATGIKKQIAWDPNHRARTTIRETTENLDHYGGAAGPKALKAWNPSERARTTIRETTENLDHYGGAGCVVVKKHIAWNTKEKARATIRETTEDNNHMGNVGASSVKKSGGYSTSKWDAKNTNRQFTSDNAYTGGANSHRKKTKSYDDAYNARTNVNKEKVAKGRRPGGGGPRLGHNGGVRVETKKLDDDRENNYARIKGSTVGNMYNPNITLTSERNHLPQHDIRMDTALLDAYKRNPLTQSLSSYY